MKGLLNLQETPTFAVLKLTNIWIWTKDVSEINLQAIIEQKQEIEVMLGDLGLDKYYVYES